MMGKKCVDLKQPTSIRYLNMLLKKITSELSEYNKAYYFIKTDKLRL